MNPVLKKLRDRSLSSGELANLLQKHIGDGLNEIHCREAVEALRRISDEGSRVAAEVTAELVRHSCGDCEAVQRVIEMFRAMDVG